MKTSWKHAKTLSRILIVTLLLNLIPIQAFAADRAPQPVAGPDGICEHHPFHTEECGYVSAVPETPCTHIHTEDCWRQKTRCVYDDSERTDFEGESDETTVTASASDSARESKETAVTASASDSAHECSEDTGCVTKVLDCQHRHNEACGYVPAVPGHACEFNCPVCSQTEGRQTAPYYLLLIHTLDYNGTQYGLSEVIGLTEDEIGNGGLDLQQYVLEKEGMTVAGISCFNPETGDLEEVSTLSPDSFAEGGDPESGEGYLAVQAMIEYRVLDGYRPVLQGNSAQPEDPYGIMPLTSFEGGNIKDITFVPADVLTVRLQYKYSPTGGLAGMDAADSQVFQLNVDGVTRDENGNLTIADSFTETWDLPCYNGTLQNPTLEGFRIVLDPAPLNAFVNAPKLAEKAMEGQLSQSEIQQALEDDSFSVNVNDPDMPVYQWQVEHSDPPDRYEDYTINDNYGNRYSDLYNEAWDNARKIETDFYTAQASQKAAVGNQGANALNDPQLVLTMTPEQCAKVLNSNSEITITVYYRRNAGFYHVGHWVPQTGLSDTDKTTYTQTYSDYNQTGVGPFDQGYIMVFLERKQGRVGALTNARANPPEAEGILSAFLSHAVNQKTIEADTRVDILYDTADRYGLIFQTEDSYIPRQYVNKGYKVTFTSGSDDSSGMVVTDKEGNLVSDRYVSYENPKRQGYKFAGWKYEVRSDVSGTDVVVENGRNYKTIDVNEEWELTETVIDEAVVVRDSDSGDAKMIYLSPVWTPAMANVRVVYWTEDLSGGANDVQVTVTKDESNGQADYLQNLDELKASGKDYQNGSPDDVGTSFSNVGSFTFMAPTNFDLNLFMDNGAFAAKETDSFKTTGERTEYEGTLKTLIDDMFPIKMQELEVKVSTGESINPSKFYHPYSVQTPPSDPAAVFDPEHSRAKYTVAADGSTVINVYYARNVYKLDFTYYGQIDWGSGTKYVGEGGLVVATNTIGYSVRDKSQITGTFDYNYQSSSSDNIHKNRWQLVDVTDGTPSWTVPQTLAISAKYDANLQEVWPVSRGEVIALNMPQTELDNHMKNVAVFMSWGATAGPFNETYRTGASNESTIIGNYRAIGADIIADPESPSTVHHLVGYWWNQNQSYYRRNACYEVPGLTSETLLDAVGTGDADVKTFDLATGRTWKYDDNLTPRSEAGNFNVVPIDVTEDEKARRDTMYLVPVNGSSLDSYFEDYRSNFIVVDDKGEPDENGGYYAVRRIGLENNSRVYALGRQAMSVSNNYIKAQEPTDMPHMTKAAFTYTCEGNPVKDVYTDHDSRTWDDWGRTAPGLEPKAFIALGTVETPYDIWFYYDRDRFTIYYMVASRNSTSGEYEIGRHETIYGQNMSRYNLDLNLENGTAARMYSNDTWFTSSDYWTPTNNGSLAPVGSSSPANGLNAQGYTRLSPDSAVDGAGKWVCAYWSLDRSGNGVMNESDWNKMVTGNLRVFAQWTPPQYKVKFDFDGGSYNGSETFPIQTVKANVGYTSSENSIPSPTRDGFIFNGWEWYEAKADMTAGNPLDGYNFETPLIRDVVLRAKWTPSVKTSYNYKIWYLTDEPVVGSVTLPGVEGSWLTDNRGTPRPDSEHAGYTYVLGCQYVGEKRFPENTVLSLAAVSIPGYTPVKISTTLPLDGEKNGTGAADTENVAYFYYRKSQVKSYTVRFQLWDKTGEEGILDEFTTQSVIADGTYFTPGEETWKRLRDAGYYLVQMNADGTAKNGEPIAAKSYLELSEFINSEIARFDGQPKGTNMTVTFKVAPYLYTIQYHVGTVKQGSETVTPGSALERAMQAALDRLAGEAVQAAVAAGENPTRYTVTDFNGGFSFTLKNPVVVKDPDDASKEWRFTGWSPAPGTNVVSLSRSVAGEYPSLEIERSEGDLEFLANWELTNGTTPPVDPENPPVDPDNPPLKPEDPPVEPEKPPVDPDNPSSEPDNPPSESNRPPANSEKSPLQPEKPPVEPTKPENPENLPTELPNPNIPDAPEVITILEDGVPKTYRKVWDSRTNSWAYILEEDVPLYYMSLPKTGENRVFPWGLFHMLSLLGLAAVWLSGLFRNRKKQNKF